MIHAIMKSSSVERLVGILRNRYGMGLELSFIFDSSRMEFGDRAFFLKEGALEIPLFSNDTCLGIARVPNAAPLNESTQESISDLVKLIMEPALYHWVLHNRSMSQLEPAVADGPKALDQTGNATDSPEGEGPAVILLVGRNPHRLPRFAVQIHESTGRWAFMKWEELRAGVKSVRDLRDLGALTVFVDDILHLSESEKDLLNAWVRESDPRVEPVLILGSSRTALELRAEGILPSSLLEHAERHQVETDRLPADGRANEEAIKLLLDKETRIHNH